MNEFNKFYLWGANMKFHMCLYTVAAIFLKSVANLIAGVSSVSILIMAQMLFVSLAFACVESLLFPKGKEWGVTGWRVILWAVLANVFYVGGALVLDWFAGAPVWCGILLLVIMEAGLFAMWYLLWLENRQDNRNLNACLKSFQKE